MGAKQLDFGVNAVKFIFITMNINGTSNLLLNSSYFASFEIGQPRSNQRCFLAKHLTVFPLQKVSKSTKKHYLNLCATIVAYGR